MANQVITWVFDVRIKNEKRETVLLKQVKIRRVRHNSAVDYIYSRYKRPFEVELADYYVKSN